jgi:hypothetical protein
MKKGYQSEILKKLNQEMEAESWYIKISRKIKIHLWIWRCLIFNRK